MSSDLPVTGRPIIDTMTRVFYRLGRRPDQLLRPPVPPPPRDMTDRQLQRDIHDVGGRLLNSLGPVIQRSFADGTVTADPRFRHPLPTDVTEHVLMMFTQANDSFGLSLRGLNAHATASALGPIRNMAETLALTRWLLEDPDEGVRRGRGYRLTMNGIDQYRDMAATLMRIAPQGPRTLELAPRLMRAADRMERDLVALAGLDGVTIADKPNSMSRLIEQYLPESGGYMFYAVLSRAGVHPGAARALLFYLQPDTGRVDFDFKGLYHVRAYWIAESIRLHLHLGHLAAPVLGWQEWEAMADVAQRQLQPLAEEAERRFIEPFQRAIANAPTLP